ncbi:hypothetical protein DSO57_1017695 [Entomophthora muscae]|uniref:Uncharacterized protein n=1 Tax=Entomophthora muscae TaxID=34485 RepID=A0ACC2T4X1_9FUNG|nr:hypothetical protein DSO57_1017695 [Entomophthora muscae]
MQSMNVPHDLFFNPDTGFLGNALHQVLVDNVHIIKTCSKVQASQEATKEVSKPYACQLLDNSSDMEPQSSGDATPLRGVTVASPMETMKDHHPELCNIIFKFLSTANNLDIHLVNKIVWKIGLAPDIDHNKQYGNAGLDCTTTQGVYSALPLRFGSLVVSAQAIVLPNENYYILIGALFM